MGRAERPRAGKISEGQGVLFPELFPERQVPVETEGPSVSLYAHTYGLHRALAQLGRISRNTAAITKEVPIPTIEHDSRFRSNIEVNIEERWRDTYDSFVGAYAGGVALKTTAEIDPTADMKQEWSRFVNAFAGPSGRKARDQYRNRLERNAKRRDWTLSAVR